MNLDQIAARISAPDTCLGSEIPALKELTEKYPFSQVFSILYLKALSSQNDIGFDEALQQHAYKVSDRMKLYDLIHGSVAAREMAEEEDLPEIEAETINSFLGRGIEEDGSLVKDPDEETREENALLISPAREDDASSEEEIESPPVSFAAEKDLPEGDGSLVKDPDEETLEENELLISLASENSTNSEAEIDELELEIISQVVATVYNDNLEHSIPEKPVEEKKSETLITPVPVQEDVVLESKRSFSSWLKAGNQEASRAEKPMEPSAAEMVKPVEKQTDKIIDKFIEKEPTISRPKKEFYSPTKKAKESVSAEGLIYTETLAEIFAIQGNFPKAIVAYEQLMLTNPEKKIFFAQRIKELKEKLNT